MGEAVPHGRFPASQRIRKRGEFREVQSHGRRVVTQHFVFLIFRRTDAVTGAAPRLGITASRKVGNACVRNRAKRLIREAFRATPPMWKPEIDVVVIVRSALSGLGLADVVSEWRAASSRIAAAGRAMGQPRLGAEV